MVFGRNDVKRRGKDLHDPLSENPKRMKVQAQRKFAQGSGMNSPVKEMNLFKEKEKAKPSDDPNEEVLPRNQPPTEDFLSFLCFRGTKYLTPRLNIFSEVSSAQRKSSASSKSTANSSSGQKNKAGSSSPEQKKRLGSRPSGLQKGNAVRARTASNERQALKKKAIEHQLRRKAAKQRPKPIRKPHPAILKRLGATRLRKGLRSSGQLPPGSDLGLNSERKPKRGRPKRRKPPAVKKRKMESLRGKPKAEEEDNSSIEEESDEEEEASTPSPVVEAASKQSRESTRKSLRSRGTSSSPAQSPKKSRPMRKTKEAATLYMEMLTKDLRNPEEESDDEYVRNFPDLPSSQKTDKNEEETTESGRRGKLPKRRSSPVKDENPKQRKLSKEKREETSQSSAHEAKHAPAPNRKVAPRGRPALKSRGRPLRTRNIVKTSIPPRINKSLRLRRMGRVTSRLVKEVDLKNQDSEEESSKEESNDEEMDEEVSDDKKRMSSTSKNVPKTADSSKRVTRNTKISSTTEDKNTSKKRKNVSESSSPSFSEESDDESLEDAPKSNQNQRRSSDRRKSLKVEDTENTSSKRNSLRSSKMDSHESENVRRSRRNKNSDDEDFQAGNIKSFGLRSKYKEDSEEDSELEDFEKDFEEDFEEAPKTRSSLRHKTDLKSDDDWKEIIKANSKKSESSSQLPKKNRGSKKSLNSDDDIEDDVSPRRTRNSSNKKKFPHESEEEKELKGDGPVTRKTRGSSLRNKSFVDSDLFSNNKSLLQDDDDDDESEEESIKVITSNSRPKRSTVKEDIDIQTDDDECKTTLKSRGSLLKESKISEKGRVSIDKDIQIKSQKRGGLTRKSRDNKVENEAGSDIEVKPSSQKTRGATQKKNKDEESEVTKTNQKNKGALQDSLKIKTSDDGESKETKAALKPHGTRHLDEGDNEVEISAPKSPSKSKDEEDHDEKIKVLKRPNQKSRSSLQKNNEKDVDSLKNSQNNVRKNSKEKEVSGEIEEEVKKTNKNARCPPRKAKDTENDLKTKLDQDNDVETQEKESKDKLQISSKKQKKVVPDKNDDVSKSEISGKKSRSSKKENDKALNSIVSSEIENEKNNVTVKKLNIDGGDPPKELLKDVRKGRKPIQSSRANDHDIEIKNETISKSGKKSIASVSKTDEEPENNSMKKEVNEISPVNEDEKKETKKENSSDDMNEATQVSKIVKEIEMLANKIIQPSIVKLEEIDLTHENLPPFSEEGELKKINKIIDIKKENIEKKFDSSISKSSEKIINSGVLRGELSFMKSTTLKEDSLFRIEAPSSDSLKPPISEVRELPAKVVDKELPLRKPRKSFCSDDLGSGEMSIPHKVVKPFLVEKKDVREFPIVSSNESSVNLKKAVFEDVKGIDAAPCLEIKKVGGDLYESKSKTEDIKKSKLSYEVKDLSIKNKESEKLKDTKFGNSFKSDANLKRQTRLSVGSPERDDKREKRYDSKDKYVDDFDTIDLESDPDPLPVKSGRKPSLTARAQYVNRSDVAETPLVKSNEKHKSVSGGKRKSAEGKVSCETIGSTSISVFDNKVVVKNISETTEVQKASRKSKNPERRIDLSAKFEQFKEVNLSLRPNVSVSSTTPDYDKTDREFEGKDKEVSKPSIGDTWRQAFKNAKIPKPGHLSPVPHSVKPFVRQKLPSLTASLQNKTSEDKSKTPPNLSPFKAMIASQNQRSLSPDKRNLSPAHKVNFVGFESPTKKLEDVKIDSKKQETPVKSLTQLQYEKRSSEFINSYLEPSPPATLPAFESIRAFKKELRKDETKSPPKTETPTARPASASEASAKPSTEGKHLNLPLAVEHTLRKNSPITVSKKPPAKPVQINLSVEKRVENVPLRKPVLPPVTLDPKIPPSTKTVAPQPSCPPVTTAPPPAIPAPPNPSPPIPSPTIPPSHQPLPPARDLLVRHPSDLNTLAKKKVNMTAEEINRWLNDGTSSGITHKKDCGIFDNSKCECSYLTGEVSLKSAMEACGIVTKEEKIDHGVVEPPVQLRELDKNGKYMAETISTCKVEDYKEKILSKSSPDNKMAPPKSRRTSGHDRLKVNKSMSEEEMCEYDFRFDRMSNSPRESVSDVSSHRDDASSSSEVPERKIFHQKRSAPKRPSLSSPTAFSVENESSIYAFKPDPPTSENRPFRRGRGKSGEHDQPSSSSIAVQVNIEKNESDAGGLECSTQTERPSDDSEGQLFYIPLHDEVRSGLSGLPQGVAVKLDTEGPDQRVIMRAKLVTKPSSSFPSSASSSRSILNSMKGNQRKPEQKVRPLWKAPVGKVQPTVREPLTSDQGTGTDEKLKQVSHSSQSTQVNQAASGSEPHPKPPRSSTKAEKQPKSQAHEKVSEKTPAEVAAPAPTPPTAIQWKGPEFPSPDVPPTLVEAPTFYPSEKEFQEPLEYIEKITPLAQSFGICRIVPPSSFKPECKVSDDMRFTAYNHYIHKLMDRWGPNVKELCAIKKYLTTQSINLVQLPLIGSMEIDLPRLYQTVQQQGGLKEVIEKKRWGRVADAMKIPKTAQDRLTKLDDIYCKYLLPYDTLSFEERSQLFEQVEEEWKERKRKQESDEEPESGGESNSDESSDLDDGLFECISKGKTMPLSGFFRTARNTMFMWFKETTPSSEEVEAEFWRHVTEKACHVCVHAGSIDTGTCGCGFPTTKTSATSRHPWNLKVFTNSSGSILRSAGSIVGINVPTLHVGMLFSSCCWYRDPHSLPWIEYLHTGANKIWYGVPDSRAGQLKSALYPRLPKHIRDRPIWLPSDLLMVPPQYLLEGGLSLCRVVQEPGQFILVFPKAFTSSISTGYVVSESVYFAQSSWLTSAFQVFKDMQESCEPPIFSLHKLLFSIANDTRYSADILTQILPMLEIVIDRELEARKKLENLGIACCEKLASSKTGRRKKQEEVEENLECDSCRGLLFLSMVSHSTEDINYCADHAFEIFSKDSSQLKSYKLSVVHDEEAMEEIVEKVKSRIETKSQKKQKDKGALGS